MFAECGLLGRGRSMCPLSTVFVLEVFQSPPLSPELAKAVPSSSSSLFSFLCGTDVSPLPIKQKEMAEVEHDYCVVGTPGGHGGYLNIREEELGPLSLSNRGTHSHLLGPEP